LEPSLVQGKSPENSQKHSSAETEHYKYPCDNPPYGNSRSIAQRAGYVKTINKVIDKKNAMRSLPSNEETTGRKAESATVEFGAYGRAGWSAVRY